MLKLVQLIEKYVPDFGQKIVPASAHEIAKFDRVAGPLPGAYKHFLATMGMNTGPFKPREANFDLQIVKACYYNDDWLKRDRYLFVASDEGMAGWDYFLDRTMPHGDDDCMVVLMEWGPDFDPEERYPLYAGLEEMLYCEAFEAYVEPLKSAKTALERPEKNPPRGCDPAAACALAETLGFVRLPPATRCALYERSDATFRIFQQPMGTQYFLLKLTADDPQELERLAAHFRKQLGLVPSRW